MSRFTVLAASSLFLIAAAATVPVRADAPVLSVKDRHQMQDEQKQGQQVADQIAKEGHLLKDKAKVDRVNAIGQKLAAVANVTRIPAGFGNDSVYPFKWTFSVVQDKDVNAFTLPGGFVYVNSGLLDFVRSDDELAAVLAHEITHAAHHHAAKLAHESRIMNNQWLLAMIAAGLAHVNPGDIANIGATAQMAQEGVLNNHYSEDAERDADHGGLILMQKSGYDPAAMLTFMERLHDLESRSISFELGILQDHPFTEQRIAAIQDQLKDEGVTVTPADIARVTRPDQFATKTNGSTTSIVLGDTVCARLNDPTGARAQSLIAALNAQLMTGGLASYQIDAAGNRIVLSDRTILTLTSADAALIGVPTEDQAAQTVQHDLQRAMYIASFNKTPVDTPKGHKKSDKDQLAVE